MLVLSIFTKGFQPTSMVRTVIIKEDSLILLFTVIFI